MTKLAKITIGKQFADETTLQDWVTEGNRIYMAAERLTWELADWAAFGERTFGALKEFCETHRLNYQTISNYAYVASNVDFSRRREKLTISHHMEVAPLPSRQQEEWLGKAERNAWSVAELRRQIRGRAAPSDGVPFKFEDKPAVDLHQILSSKPADYWNPKTRGFWRDRLRPIVQFYEAHLSPGKESSGDTSEENR